MKSFIICLTAAFFAFPSFAQKAKGNPDTTLTSYLTYSCPVHPEYVSNVARKCPKCNNDMVLSKKEGMKMGIVKLYTCSMDTQVISTKDGKCPICNMDLVELKTKEKIKKD